MTRKLPVAPLYYTVEEAAPLMRLGRSTLYRLIKKGRVTYTLDLAGRIRFTPQDIQDNLDDRRRRVIAA